MDSSEHRIIRESMCAEDRLFAVTTFVRSVLDIHPCHPSTLWMCSVKLFHTTKLTSGLQ